MKYTDGQLQEALKQGIFTEEQVKAFRTLAEGSEPRVTGLQKVLYYGGALLIISAVTWLMYRQWSRFGDYAITVFTAFYFVVFGVAGLYLYFRKKLTTAGGLLLSIPIAVTPLFVFSILAVNGFWPNGYEYHDYYVWIKGRWLILELSTLLVAAVVFWTARFPFHVFLISGTLWFLSMDIVPVLSGQNSITWEARSVVSVLFGLVMMTVAYLCDLKYEKDYAFWLYFFGLLTFCGGLSMRHSGKLEHVLIYGCVHALLVLAGVFLARTVFLVFGTMGLAFFLGKLAYDFFRRSAMFPVFLTLIGVCFIILGIWYQKHRKSLEEGILAGLPEGLKRLRPARARNL
ncbi:MAG: hypothetical protein LBQ97_07165 [Fusobacteriaceae bacterium]|jgi:hypothetical protein|nr:hypothetical protein [Fusobacteriaceae bacterium]